MNHYVYEITNNINGKKYIGKRTCKCPIEEDKYMGSGYLLKKAIKKHGIENFTKKILFIAGNEEEAYQKEFETIESVQAYKNPNYYNIQRGGKGGWIGLKLSEETKAKLSLSKKGRYKGCLNPNYNNHKLIGEKNPMFGVSPKERMSKEKYEIWKKKMKENKIGSKNPNYGNRGSKNPLAKKVLLLNNYKIFDSIIDAKNYVNLKSPSVISSCCRGKRKSAGKINGQPAKWMYYDEYLAKEGLND